METHTVPQREARQKPAIALFYSHPANQGGTGSVAAALANRLAQDYEVHMLASYGVGEEQHFPLTPDVRREVFLVAPARIRSMAVSLFKPVKSYLLKNDIKLVLAIGNTQAFELVPLACTLRDTHFIYCDHGSLMSQWDDASSRLLSRLCVKTFDSIVALTEKNRSDYLARLHAKPDNVQVIHNWIDAALVAKPTQYDRTAKRLFWAGRLSSEKGVDLLLDIAQAVLPHNPEWEWHVFGGGELEDEFLEQTKLRGLEDQLIYRGFSQKLKEHYPNFAVVTLTSYREGLPMVLLEGKAAGIPLISFDVDTGPREIIRDGRDGFLISCYDVQEYAQRLQELMRDTDLRVTMSGHSHENLATFEQESIYQQWKRLIDGTLGRGTQDAEGGFDQ